MGLLALGFSKMTMTQLKSGKTVESNFDRIELNKEISHFLGVKENCTKNFGALNSTATDLQEIKKVNDTVKYSARNGATPGTLRGGTEISPILLIFQLLETYF
jgi:hypothetical protein